jgi:hypothetical protein
MGVLSRAAGVVLLLACAASTPPAAALETDQFYAWLRPMRDGTDVANAWMRTQIARAVEDANARETGRGESCEDVARRVRRGLYFFIFQEIELWATQTPLLDRVPSGMDETLAYRDRYLFATDNPFDLASWMPPSPTIEIDGVRLGTDKLSHFASVGWLYHRRYHKALRRGATRDEAVREAIRFGVLSEKTIFGASSTGALSLADLEANYQGMRFYEGLCGGERPMLERGPAGWAVARPFDFRDFVTPEWDESWNPPIYRRGRWDRVREALRRHCPELDDPRVVARREAYAARDRVTPTEEVVRKLVAEEKLRDPVQFDIETVCREAGR